ncbi:hypothetical protein [Sphingomonas sp. 28-63-12]|uniref:P-type ATPase n=1 Tax=Sphingomonas sp. 28-63-12 TaxID=1970434 RepID=UPI0035A8A748
MAIRAIFILASTPARRIAADGSEAEVPLFAFKTGEFLPIAKADISPRTGGTLDGTGSLVMQTLAVGNDKMLARIVPMVAEAQRSHALTQAVADPISGWFVPLVILFAVATFAVWSMIGPSRG